MEENKKIKLEELNNLIANQHAQFKNFLSQYKLQKNNTEIQEYDIDSLKVAIKNNLRKIVYMIDKIDFEDNKKLEEYLSNFLKNPNTNFMNPRIYVELYDLWEKFKEAISIQSLSPTELLSQHLTSYNQILEMLKTQIEERNLEIERLEQKNSEETTKSDIAQLKDEIKVLQNKQSGIISLVQRIATIENIDKLIESETKPEQTIVNGAGADIIESVKTRLESADKSNELPDNEYYTGDISFNNPPVQDSDINNMYNRAFAKIDETPATDVPENAMSHIIKAMGKKNKDNPRINLRNRPKLTIDVSQGIVTFEREGKEPVTIDLETVLDNRQERVRILGEAKNFAFDKDFSLANMGLGRDRYNPAVLAVLTDAKEKELLINYLAKTKGNKNLNNLGFEYIVKIQRGDKLSNKQFNRLNKALVRDGKDLHAEKELKGVKKSWLGKIGYRFFGKTPALPEVSPKEFEKNPHKEKLKEELKEAVFNEVLTRYTDKLKEIERQIREGKYIIKKDSGIIEIPYTEEQIHILELQKRLINSKIRCVSNEYENTTQNDKMKVYQDECLLSQARINYYTKKQKYLESKGKISAELEKKINILKYIHSENYINFCNALGLERLAEISPNGLKQLEYEKQTHEELKEKVSFSDVANFERQDVITSQKTPENVEARYNLKKSFESYRDVKKYGSRTKLSEKLARGRGKRTHKKEMKELKKRLGIEKEPDDGGWDRF